MSDAEAKLKVTIETAATGSGTQQTAAGLKDVTGAAEKAAPAMGQLGGQTKQTAAELGRGVEVGNAASMMVQNLASSTKGGATGFLSLARGAFGAGVALKGVLASLGPFGAIAAGIGIALGLITAALRKNEEAAEAQRKKLEEVNQQKLDKAIEEQSKLGRAAGEAVEQIEAERAALERIADAELALRKSRIDADKSLSDEEKARQKLALDRQREDEKRAGLLADQETKANKLQEAASKSRKAAENVEGEYNRQRNALDELTAATKAYADAKAIVDMQAFAGGEASPEDQSALLAARDRKQRAQAFATGVSPESLAAAEKAAKDARKLSDADRDRAEAARTGANLEYDTQQAEDTRRNETRRNEDLANRPETEAEKTKREADQAKARAKAELAVDNLGLGVWQNRAAGGQVDDITLDVLKKRYPKVQFRTPASPSAPITPASPYSAAPAATHAAPNTMQLGGGALPMSQPGSGNTVTRGNLPMGQQSPNAVMQRGGGLLPSDLTRTGLPSGITSGPADGGFDNKQFQQAADKINDGMTKAAEQEIPDLKPAADAADQLVKKGEELATSLQQTGDSMVQAFGAVAEQQSGIVAVQGNQQAQIAQLISKVRQLDNAITTLRQRSQVA